MVVLGFVYIAAYIAAAVLLALLFWVPFKLYAIHREMEELNRRAHAGLQFLMVIAYTVSPPDGRTIEEKVHDFQEERIELVKARSHAP